MTDAQHAELIGVIGLAGQTNHLVTAMQIPVDPEFEVRERRCELLRMSGKKMQVGSNNGWHV
jgi:hypothetical protein